MNLMQTLSAIAAVGAALLLPPSPERQEPTPAPQLPAVCDCCCDMGAIESLVAEVKAELQAEVDALEKRVKVIEERPLQVAKPDPLPAPEPVKVVQLKPAVVQSYTPRWQNFDGKDRMAHAAQDHGIDVSKYSQAEVLKMMDADHDRFGGNGHAAIKASRIVSQPAYARVVQPRAVTRYSYPQSNCPGGVCPMPQASVRSGWYPGKLLGR